MSKAKVIGGITVEPYAVFDGLTIEDEDFSKCDLTAVKFIDCTFIRCKFKEADLSCYEEYEDEAVDEELEDDPWFEVLDESIREFWDRDLEGLPSDRAWFSDSIFRDCDFSECASINAIFSSCEIDGGTFSNSELEKCWFVNVNFRNVNMEDLSWEAMNLYSSEFVACNCRGAAFTGVYFDDCTFARNNFVDSSLTEVHLINVTFEDNDFDGCSAVSISIDEISTRGTTPTPLFIEPLLRAAGRTVDGHGPVIMGVIVKPGARFEGLVLRGEDFSGLDLRGATFNDCEIINCRFDGAILSEADADLTDENDFLLAMPGGLGKPVEFVSSLIVDSDFGGASMSRVVIRESQVVSSRLISADLSFGQIISSRIKGSDFSKSSTTSTSFEDCEIKTSNFTRVGGGSMAIVNSSVTECDFSSARLKSAVFSKSKVRNCNFGGVTKDSVLVLNSVFEGDQPPGDLDVSRGLSRWR